MHRVVYLRKQIYDRDFKGSSESEVKFRPNPFFWNHCRKDSDPTVESSDLERLWIFNNNSDLYRLKSMECDVIEIQSRSMSDPTFSDIYFKNKMAWVWTTLNHFTLNCSFVNTKGN